MRDYRPSEVLEMVRERVARSRPSQYICINLNILAEEDPRAREARVGVIDRIAEELAGIIGESSVDIRDLSVLTAMPQLTGEMFPSPQGLQQIRVEWIDSLIRDYQRQGR